MMGRIVSKSVFICSSLAKEALSKQYGGLYGLVKVCIYRLFKIFFAL